MSRRSIVISAVMLGVSTSLISPSLISPPLVTADIGETSLDSPRAADAGAISAGLNHTCAIPSDGSLWCWGRNQFGQLGIGNTTDQSSPVRVGLDTNWRSVSAGGTTTCAVTTGNEVYCWGYNYSGQTGVDKGTTSVTTPTKVTALGSSVHSVSVGQTNACAVTTSGAVYCWGSNAYGQLGNGSSIGSTSTSHTPVAVRNLPGTYRAVAVGTDGVCALQVGGGPYCWGTDLFGQRGDGATQATTADDPTPAVIATASNVIVGLAAGPQSNCMILSTGAVRCWGQNTDNYLSTTSGNMTSPLTTSASPFSGVAMRAFSVGSQFACGIRADNGRIVCGGLDTGSTAGGTVTTGQVSKQPTATGFLAVTAGNMHACAIDSDRRLVCWGRNSNGQVGIGSTGNAAEATVITFGANATQTLGAEPVAPGAPASVTVVPRYRELAVLWAAPAQNGTATITSYQHRRSSDGGASWTSWADFTSSEASARSGVIVGLLDAVSYIVEVRAVSADGTGPAVTSSAATTLVPCDPLIDCSLGSIGPEGGIIVHDAGVGSPWGRFILAAPLRWNGSTADPSGTWSNADSAVAAQGWPWSLPTPQQLVQVASNHNANPQLLADWPLTDPDDYWSSTTQSTGSSVQPHYAQRKYRPVRTLSGPRPLAAPALTTTTGELSITANWTAPSTATNAPVSEYETRISSDGGTTWAPWASQGLATTLSLTGLSSGASYRVEVRAVNTAGAGAAAQSESITMTPTITPTTQTVTGIVDTPITDTAAFTTGNLDGAVTYAVTTGTLPAGLTLDSSTGVISGIPTTTSSATITITASGATAGSASSSVTFAVVVPAPDSVVRVDAVDGLDGVILEWLAPTSGEAPTGYEYATSTDGGTTFSAFTPVPPTISSSDGSTRTRVTTTITAGLTRGVETMFQVRATTAGGAGPAFPDRSWMSTMQWDQWSPRAVAKVSDPCDAMNDCEVGDVGPGGGVIVYDHGSNASWGRYLEAAPAFWAGASGDPSALFGCDGTQVDGASGSGPAAIGAGPANVTAILAACSTAGIAARVADAHSVTINGTVVDDWHLPSQGDLDAMNMARTKLGGWKFGGFDSDEQNYASSTDFHSSNFAGIGGSRWKAFSHFVRPVRYVVGPESPSSPALIVTSSLGVVDLVWNAPSNDGGSAVTGYELRYSADGGTTWTSWTSVGAATSHSLTDLDPDGEYVIEVRALNRGGAGTPVTTSSITPAERQVDVVAGEPASLRAVFDGGVPGDGATFAVTQGTLPAGLILDPATGMITGTPTSSGATSVTIVATVGADTLTATIEFEIAAAGQVISFAAPEDRVWSATPFTVMPVSDSGLAVTVESVTPAVCTVSGNTVSMLRAGTCTLTASQSGDAMYAAAADVAHSFEVTEVLDSSEDPPGESSPDAVTGPAGDASDEEAVSSSTSDPDGGNAGSPLVSVEMQQQLTARSGDGVVLIGGVVVDVSLLQVPDELRVIPPAERTAEQVEALREVAASMLAALREVIGEGVDLPIAVRETSSGAVIVGLLRDPVTGQVVDVPVEHVVLITGGGLVIMVAGGEDGEPARIGRDGVLEIGLGGVVSVLAHGLEPGEVGEVVVMSTPRRIAEFAVAADGGVAAQAEVPADLAPGNHTVVVSVSDQAASLGFRIVAPVTLPSTGVATSPVTWAILILAIGALGLLVVGRPAELSRRSNDHSGTGVPT